MITQQTDPGAQRLLQAEKAPATDSAGLPWGLRRLKVMCSSTAVRQRYQGEEGPRTSNEAGQSSRTRAHRESTL